MKNLDLFKDGKADYSKLKTKDIEGIQCEFGFDLKPGENVLGDIVTMDVEPYEITDEDGEVREVSIYSRVILGDNSKASFHSLVRQEFARQGHPLVIPNESLEIKVSEEVASAEEVREAL